MKISADLFKSFRRKRLFRDEEALADYIEGRLSGPKKKHIDGLLTRCGPCRDEYVVFDCVVRNASVGEAEDSSPDFTRSAMQTALNANKKVFRDAACVFVDAILEAPKKFAGMVASGFRIPAYATVRGTTKVISPDMVRVTVDFSQFSADIEIEKRKALKAVIRVSVSGDKKHSGLRVTLKKIGREVASHLVNGSYVMFEGIAFDHYTLDFTMDGRLLGQYPFELKESTNG